MGWKNVSFGPIEDLVFKDDALYFNNQKVDVIRRGTELFKIRQVPKLLNNILIAQRKTGLKVINNFKMRLLGHKSLMAALHYKEFQKYLTDEEIEAINKLLPYTIKLDTCDLESIYENKNKWVLKPSDLAEGEGITIGQDVSKEDWIKNLDSANQNGANWILQEKIEIPEKEFNLINEDAKTIMTDTKKFDFDPHIILFKNKSEIGNILVRFSESNILNVMKGGGLTYAFFKKS